MRSGYKKIYVALLIAITSIFLVACSGKPASDGPAPDTPIENQADKAKHKTNKENRVQYENGNFDVNLEGPIFVTSLGQSADVSMLDALMKKVGREYSLDSLATAGDLEKANTLLIAAGASSKGLGAAGISVEEETKRAEEIIKMINEKDSLNVVMVHLGGQARRGTLSDKFIKMILEVSDYIIVVEEGNADGMFTDHASKEDIPISLVFNISDAVEPLEKLLGN